MTDTSREKYIDTLLFEQAEIARYSDAERWEYEESRKVFWDNYSVMKTAVNKGLKQGIEIGMQREKVESVHRFHALGLSVEQIAQGVDLPVDEVKKLLQ